MKELMYDINSGLISAVLLVSMLIAIELGFRIGYRFKNASNDASKTHINAIQASILGILALLLGFTFSISLQRFDSRSEAVVEEANAIGTAYLRAQLLPTSIRKDVQILLHEYVDLRVQAGTLMLIDRAQQEALQVKVLRTQTALWSYARQAAEANPNPVTSGLFIQSINELIDNFGKRDAALNRHVPELVLILLYMTFLMTEAIVGFAAGVAAHRPSLASYMMVMLIVVLVFIILDLDRPRRGLIEVSQKSLVDLQTSINAEIRALK